MKWKTVCTYIGVLGLLGIGFFYDYEITHALYDPQNIFGIIFEKGMLLPVIACAVISFAVLYAIQASLWKLGATIIIAISFVQEICQQFFIPISTPFILLLGSLLGILLCFLMKKISIQTLQKYEKRLTFFLCVFITSILITTIVKGIWGRIRYRELQDVQQYTKWIYMQGVNGNFSFPSGHTTAFASILCFLPIENKKVKDRLLTLGIVSLVMAMMISRLIMGAHYLSDTAVGLFITYSIYIFYKNKFYKEA